MDSVALRADTVTTQYEEAVVLEPVVRDYLTLGLRLGRLIDGFVDCWFGDTSLARQVADEPEPVPAELAADAARLAETLRDSDLDDSRRRFLAAQTRALACVARKLAGENMPFLAEIEAYFDVRIDYQDPDRYAAVRDEIADLLPGEGDLDARLAAFGERDRIPHGGLKPAAQALSAALREKTGARYPLPREEHVHYEAVTDKPWNAFNLYHGGLRSTISLNEDVGHGMSALPHLVTHEAYPGHHTEHCLKESRLVRDLGQEEHAIYLVNTPQCLISEGMGERALSVALGDGWGQWTEEVLAGRGLHIDGDLVERLLSLTTQLLPARQDAAMMLHDRGADPEDVVSFLQRTVMVPEHRARHMVRFLMDPLWRAYTVTYIEGGRLVGAWLAAGGPGESTEKRYLRLLTEPMLPSTLSAEIGAARTPAAH